MIRKVARDAHDAVAIEVVKRVGKRPDRPGQIEDGPHVLPLKDVGTLHELDRLAVILSVLWR